MYICTYRPVVPGAAVGAMAPPDFGRSINPISTKGGRLCPPKNTATLRLSDIPTALPVGVQQRWSKMGHGVYQNK